MPQRSGLSNAKSRENDLNNRKFGGKKLWQKQKQAYQQ